jgi:hypothetical protein
MHRNILLQSTIRELSRNFSVSEPDKEVSTKMKTKPQVLFIGKAGQLNPDHYSSLEEHGFVLANVPAYWDLCKAERYERCEIAVLLPTLLEAELMGAAHLIRRRWPAARILIVRTEEWWIDDALYDDRVTPSPNPELLLTAVERLAG